MNNDNLAERLKQIKRSFRLYMNGETSRSMREKGIEYKLNWGVPVTRLRTMAAEYGKDHDLAMALWQENVRECKLLATLIMPADEMTQAEVEVWIPGVASLELAEQCALNLFQSLPFASGLAYAWLSSGNDMLEVCAYHLLSRLFLHGHTPSDAQVAVLLDEAPKALQSEAYGLRRAAYNCLLHFVEQGDKQEQMVREKLEMLNLDIF